MYVLCVYVLGLLSIWLILAFSGRRSGFFWWRQVGNPDRRLVCVIHAW